MVKAKPKTGTAVANWDQELADAAAKQGDARSTGSGGSFINTRGAVFSVGGEEIGQDMNVVILDYVIENQYYDPEIPYDSDNPVPPICFAFSREEAGMAPKDVPEPQNETCGGCPQNAFGSAGKGRKGKACKNVMRLAMIAEGSLEEGIDEADVMYMKVSTTNVKHFAKFLDMLKNTAYGKIRPSWAVICEMHIKPNKDTQIELSFKRGGDIDAEQLGSVKSKAEAQLEKTMFAYQASAANEDAPPAAPANKKLQRKGK